MKSSFNQRSDPAPLLLATMACGAVYLGEYSTALSMHAVAVQLIFEVGEECETSRDSLC